MDIIVYSLFIIIPIVVVVIKLVQIRQHETELASFYKKNHYTYEDISTIRKRLRQDRELLKETEEDYKKQQKADYYYQEAKRKEAIVKRVFAYDYEEMLYQIFAPIAKNNDDGLTWHAGMRYVGKSYIVNEITKKKKVSILEAESIFNILIEHELIIRVGPDMYTLTYWLESTKLEKGLNWDVVSDTDWNLDKWMNAHGYKHKER